LAVQIEATHCGSPYQVKGTLAEAVTRFERLNLGHDQIDQLRGSSNSFRLIIGDNNAEPPVNSRNQVFGVGTLCETKTKIRELCDIGPF
jgi:hypothetical protein